MYVYAMSTTSIAAYIATLTPPVIFVSVGWVQNLTAFGLSYPLHNVQWKQWAEEHSVRLGEAEGDRER